MVRGFVALGSSLFCLGLGAASSAVLLQTIGGETLLSRPAVRTEAGPAGAGPENEAPEPMRAVPAVPSVPLPPALVRLQERLSRAHAQVDEIFIHAYDSDRVIKLIHNARIEWSRRLERCADDPCRRAVLADQLRRAEYVLRTGEEGYPGLPWADGVFVIESEWGGGIVWAYPVVDDMLLVRISVVGNLDRPSSCGLTAQGWIGPVVYLTSLDDSERPYVLQPRGADRLIIESLPDRISPHCGIGAQIEDDFVVTPSRPSEARTGGSDRVGPGETG